jgi:protein-tyrosine-phosphatase
MRVTMTHAGVEEPFTALTPEQVEAMESLGWKAKTPTKEELAQAASEQGIEIPANASKDQLERLVNKPEGGV